MFDGRENVDLHQGFVTTLALFECVLLRVWAREQVDRTSAKEMEVITAFKR